MKIEIEIPKEFEADYKQNRFGDCLSRVLADIKCGDVLSSCGLYECETIEMLKDAFKESEALELAS